VHAKNISVGTVADSAIVIDFFYEEGPGHGFNPDVRAIDVRNLTVDHAQRALALRGYPDDPVHDVRLTHVDFRQTVLPDLVENVDGLVLRDVRENGQPLPEVTR
jgi:hypothetical protein